MPVDNGGQIAETMFQFNIGDIGRPDLVRFSYRQSSEQIRVYLVLFVCLAQILLFLGIYGNQPHLNHQCPDVVFADWNTIVSSENGRHSSLAIAGMLSIDGVYYIHDEQIFLIGLALIV